MVISSIAVYTVFKRMAIKAFFIYLDSGLTLAFEAEDSL